MADRLRIGIAQLLSVEGEVAENLRVAEEAVAQLATNGARVVLLPEMHVTGLIGGAQLAQLAEPRSGSTWQQLRAMAARNKVTLVTSLPEAVTAAGPFHNAACVVGPDGRDLAIYRKIHLFDGETRSYAPGSELTTVMIEGLTCGIFICYDLEFPEVARSLAGMGCGLFLVPTANMEPWGHHHRVFLMARALENHAWVAYANRCGHSARYRFVGESALCDPFGRLVAEAGAGPELLVADVDPAEIARSRRVFDYAKERRLGVPSPRLS